VTDHSVSAALLAAVVATHMATVIGPGEAGCRSTDSFADTRSIKSTLQHKTQQRHEPSSL
jgi:hypothetical protein